LIDKYKAIALQYNKHNREQTTNSEQNWPRHQTDQKKLEPTPGKHAPTSTPKRNPCTQRNSTLARERFPKEDNCHLSQWSKPARPSKKQTGASTDKTAGVEKTLGPASVSTNQTRNPRCKAHPVNKAPKAHPKKKPLVKKKKKTPLTRKR